MTKGRSLTLLTLAFFSIFLIVTESFEKSIGLACSSAVILFYIVSQFKPVTIVNRFDGANVNFKIKDDEND